jgi:GNAT superfamily N-acetyltransferase
MISVRRFGEQEWPVYRALRLRALEESPDAFGSTFAWESVREDGHWAKRLETGVRSEWDLPLIAEMDSEAVGLTWSRIDPATPEVAHLYQVWVAPTARGQGVGRLLLEAAIEWARGAKARRMVLNVTLSESPAMRLYRRAGFAAVGSPKPLREGSPLLSQSMERPL